MTARDVSESAREIQSAIFRRLSEGERLLMAMEMSDFAHQLTEAGIRMRAPDLSDADVRRLLVETIYGFRNEKR